MGDQLIGTRRDLWCLAEYKALGMADVLVDHIQSVANVDAQFLRTDSTIALPVFDSHLLGGSFLFSTFMIAFAVVDLGARPLVGIIGCGSSSGPKRSYV